MQERKVNIKAKPGLLPPEWIELEIWRYVVGYRGLYKVSTRGQIKSLNRIVYHPRMGSQRVKGRLMRCGKDKDGYLSVQLSKFGKVKAYRVHQLVAMAFLENLEVKPIVNHIDGKQWNNNVDNLEWATHYENEKHAAENGLKASGSRNGNAKLTEGKVRVIKQRLRNGEPVFAVAFDYGMTVAGVYLIKNGKTWKNVA